MRRPPGTLGTGPQVRARARAPAVAAPGGGGGGDGVLSARGGAARRGAGRFVQGQLVKPHMDKLKDRLEPRRVGDPREKNTYVGAINSKAQLEKITELVAAGRAEGAEMYQPACDLPERGYFFRPTLFTKVAQSPRIAREEIFGPVLPVLHFRPPAAAVGTANHPH